MLLLLVAAASIIVSVNSFRDQSVFGPHNYANSAYFDIQAHRGGRANTIENTLPGFAWGLIEGANTLELDNGITKDGVVVIWHDEEITPLKCRDTSPVFPDDPVFPYVGKLIANLTFAQIKTVDCSTRQLDFPNQLTYPGTRIPSLKELFEFLDCADPEHRILLNIESKVNPVSAGRTRHYQTFVQTQHELFLKSAYYRSITYQSFDWRTLVAMKELDSNIITSALIDDYTLLIPENETFSPWLAGIDINALNGSTVGERIAEAASIIKADILSPVATRDAADPEQSGYIPFTTISMVSRAHELGLVVKPWTVNRLSVVERLFEMGVDGIISDYPDVLRRWAQQRRLPVAPRYPKHSVLACLDKFSRSF